MNLGEGQQKPEIHEEKERPSVVLRAFKPFEMTPEGPWKRDPRLLSLSLRSPVERRGPRRGLGSCCF